MLVCGGRLCAVLVCNGRLCVVLVCDGRLCAVLVCGGRLCAVLVCGGRLCAVLVCVLHIVQVEALLVKYEWIASDKQYFGKPNTAYDFEVYNPQDHSRLAKLQEQKVCITCGRTFLHQHFMYVHIRMYTYTG